MEYIYLVIDDYTPDAGSTIYGAFSSEEVAQRYIDEGIDWEYGEGRKSGNEYVSRMQVVGRT